MTIKQLFEWMRSYEGGNEFIDYMKEKYPEFKDEMYFRDHMIHFVLKFGGPDIMEKLITSPETTLGNLMRSCLQIEDNQIKILSNTP